MFSPTEGGAGVLQFLSIVCLSTRISQNYETYLLKMSMHVKVYHGFVLLRADPDEYSLIMGTLLSDSSSMMVFVMFFRLIPSMSYMHNLMLITVYNLSCTLLM